ncbi:condensation domain-containing protein, partial [Micromonospora echinospora]|uniref:condensation domain-containing protein n=1 Tax=Micromonospora echinospora TaxID=1877 RepID=UPI003CED12BF
THVSVRQIFDTPTVQGLDETLTHTTTPTPSLRPADPRPARIPLSFAQRRLWFLHRLEGPSPTYNISSAIHLSGGLDVAALRAALGDVVERHESLRTVFAEDAAGPHQVVVDAGVARPELVVVRTSARRVDEVVAEAARYGFDLAAELPVRVWLFEVAPDEHVLLLLMHHIAGDGWSNPVLARDLSTAYLARSTGRAPDWSPLPVQYADFTLWQREVLGSEEDPDSGISRQLA